MLRQKITLYLDADVKDFLEHLKETTGAPISRILEMAAMEKYQSEYQRFMESKEKSSAKQ